MDFLTRRSIRKYKDKEIEKEVLDELIKTTLLSPSGCNGRPYEFILVTDKEKIKQLACIKKSGIKFIENAPLLVVILWKEYPTGEDDASIASTILQLKAHQLGLGSCWIQTKGYNYDENTTSEEKIKEILSIPKEIYVNNIVSVGYADEEPKPYSLDDANLNKLHYNSW